MSVYCHPKKLIWILFFLVTSCLWTWKCWCFPCKMCSERRKNHGRGQKKLKSTSSAIFGVETAAKSCELKRCADRVRNRTDEANLNFSPELYRLNWTFRLPPKRQLSILLNFFSSNKFVFDFCCLCLFCYSAGQHAISRQKHGIQHRVISSVWSVLVTLWCGRTDGRSRTITSLPKFLGLIAYQISLAMVLRWRSCARAPL